MRSHWLVRSEHVCTRCLTIWWRWIPRWCWRCSPPSWATVWKRPTAETDMNKPPGNQPPIYISFLCVLHQSFSHHCNFFLWPLTLLWSPTKSVILSRFSCKQDDERKDENHFPSAKPLHLLSVILSNKLLIVLCYIIFNSALHLFTSFSIWTEKEESYIHICL